MSFQPKAKARLERLTLARSTLTAEQSRELGDVLLGCLSNYITDEEWASCLDTVLRELHKRQGRTA